MTASSIMTGAVFKELKCFGNDLAIFQILGVKLH